MNDVASFLDKHKAEIEQLPESVPEEQEADNSVINVVILGANETHLRIGHLGRKFSIQRDKIVAINDAPENMPNPFGRGRPAQLIVPQTASLQHEQSISVSELEVGQPFAAARPTTLLPSAEVFSSNELVWRQTNGVHPNNLHPFVTASTSYSRTSTISNGVAGLDDSQGDDIGFLDD
jgi:hypothetical protein